MSSTRWGPGYQIAGRYQLVEQLGRGGMGEVWRAEHVTLRAPVAIKLIDPKIAAAPVARTRFLREARAAAALQSPHVVHTSDFGVHEDTPFIAMELLRGESLAQRLRRMRALSPIETARVVTHVCRAIQKAHDAGIVHRDLKPDNVFISTDDEEEIVKVLDFGVAKAMGGNFGDEGGVGTRTGALLGTPYYMSPEQAQGDRHVDHRSDLWSVGVIAFQCLTGRLPFEADGLAELVMKICAGPIPRPSALALVPGGFDAWFERALMRDPSARFASAKEMSRALRIVLTPGDADATGTHAPAELASSPYTSASVHALASVEQSGQLAVIHSAVDARSAEATGPRPGISASAPWVAPAGLAATTGNALASELGVPRAPGGGHRVLVAVLAVLGTLGLLTVIAVGVALRFYRTSASPVAPSAAAVAPAASEGSAPELAPIAPGAEAAPPEVAPELAPSAPPPAPRAPAAAAPAKNAKSPAEKPAVSAAPAAPKASAAPAKPAERLGF